MSSRRFKLITKLSSLSFLRKDCYDEFVLIGTNCYFRVLSNLSLRWYIRFEVDFNETKTLYIHPESDCAEIISFERILLNCGPDLQEQLLFNLDLFR